MMTRRDLLQKTAALAVAPAAAAVAPVLPAPARPSKYGALLEYSWQSVAGPPADYTLRDGDITVDGSLEGQVEYVIALTDRTAVLERQGAFGSE